MKTESTEPYSSKEDPPSYYVKMDSRWVSPVTPEALVQFGLLKNLKLPVNILGEGEGSKALTVSAHKFSGAAQKKIEDAGGKVEVIGS